MPPSQGTKIIAVGIARDDYMWRREMLYAVRLGPARGERRETIESIYRGKSIRDCRHA
jgi:hypothetical protein